MSLRISGNRLIETLPGLETRPTMARVREALFSIWQGQIGQCRWLDLCVGNGSMGAEALCQGAQLVLGVDMARDACQLTEANWKKIAKPPQRCYVMQSDVVKGLARLSGETYDRIYFDPPYRSDLYQPVLDKLSELGLLASGGEIAIEHNPGQLDYESEDLVICRQKTYGKSALTFYRRRSEAI